jgi:hypothetical protein
MDVLSRPTEKSKFDERSSSSSDWISSAGVDCSREPPIDFIFQYQQRYSTHSNEGNGLALVQQYRGVGIVEVTLEGNRLAPQVQLEVAARIEVSYAQPGSLE